MSNILSRQNNIPILLVVIATGISSVVTQLLVIREFLVQFQGNEFVIALILFSWLVQGGIGTYLSSLFIKLVIPSPAILARFSLIIAGLPSVMIILIRELRDILFIHGSSVGFYQTFAFIFFTTAPYALLIGFVLPYSLFVLRSSDSDYPGSYIYITDNLGDIAGGALFTFFLVYFFSPLESVLISNILLLAATFYLFTSSGRGRVYSILCTGLVAAVLVFGVFIEEKTLSPAEGRLAYYNESKYGRIEIHQDGEQYTLFGDGLPVLSSQNTSAAEETIHYPLSQLSLPKHILIISSESNIMEEIEKYNPESIDYIELDPDLSDALFRFGLVKKIKGLNVINRDGRSFLSETDKIYDAIILNLPEPDTYQINRFYTDNFYASVKKHLSPAGVLSFSMEGYDNYIAEPQRQKISSVHNTLSRHFKNVILLPGQNIFFLASQSALTTDIPLALSNKGISTAYISSYYYGNLTEDRINQLKELIDVKTPFNTDTYPQLMRIMFLQWFAKFSTSPYVFVIIISVLSFIYLFFITKEEFVLFSTGCMAMGTEILIIFAFQIFYGYIYLKIGIIITVFLAGLLPGAWIGNRYGSNKKISLVLTDILLILLTGILITAFKQDGYPIPLFAFLLYGFIVSMICGYQFPTALKITGESNPAVTKLFSADLIGAAAGTLVISVAVIPYFGIIWAAICLIALKAVSLSIMALKS
jgi:spermidine synthase